MEPITELDALRYLKTLNGTVVFGEIVVCVSACGAMVLRPTFLDAVIDLKATLGERKTR